MPQSTENMITAGVFIQKSARATFMRHLDAAGYSYTEGEAGPELLILKVRTRSPEDLEPIIAAAYRESQN